MNNTPGERFDRASTGEAYKPESRMHDPRDIKIQPGWNMRDMTTPETLAHVAGLEESIIAAGGVKEPISVRYDKVTGVRTLVKGNCRLQACLNLRKKGVKLGGEDVMIPCVRVEGDEATLTAENILSNGGLALTQWEAGVGFRKLAGWGWSKEKIAAYIGKPIRYVSEAIALSNVSIEAKSMLAAGQVTAGAVLSAVKNAGPDAAAEVLQTQVAEKKAKAPAGKKPAPVSRPKTPSAKEKIANTVPTILELADKLARMVVDEDQSIDKVIAAARAYLKARGV